MSTPAQTPASRHGDLDRWRSGRLEYLDNLKVLLIAGIIAAHAVLGYASLEVWTYTELRETTISPVVEAVLFLLLAPFGLLLIGLLFLIAGLMTPPSLTRKGPRRFATDRLLRLGVPFAVYVLLIQPAVLYVLLRAVGKPAGFWQQILDEPGRLDTGPLWFVGVLLVFSLAYAGWAALRPNNVTRPSSPITMRRLWVTAAIVAPASFVVRLVYAYGSEAGFTDLNFWQWPTCIAVFAIGIAAAGQGWTSAVPDGLRRTCRTVTLVAVASMAVLLGAAGSNDEFEQLLGGPNGFALGFAVVDAVLNVFGSIWLLGAAQRHLAGPRRWAGPTIRRSAYAAFIVQAPVLIALALLLRDVPIPAEAKALIVASVGVVACFALGGLLTRLRGLSRVV